MLKKFQPTKIALESPAGSAKIQKQYKDDLAENYPVTRSEREADHEFYMGMAQFVGNGEYPGPDLLAG